MTATLDRLSERRAAAEAAFDAAQAVRAGMGEPAFSWNAGAIDRLRDSGDDLSAAEAALRALTKLAAGPMDTIASWSAAAGPLTAAVQYAPAADRGFYIDVLLEAVEEYGLQGIYYRPNSFGPRGLAFAYTRIRPRSWGNRDRFFTYGRHALAPRTEGIGIVDSTTQTVVRRVQNHGELKAAIAELEAATPLPPPGVLGYPDGLLPANRPKESETPQ